MTSGGMYAQALRDDDPEYLHGEYSPTTAYARSKRTQVELLPVLQERWPRLGVHATHPGWADTPGVQESLPTFRRLTSPFLRDAAGGADTTVWLRGHQPAPAGPGSGTTAGGGRPACWGAPARPRSNGSGCGHGSARRRTRLSRPSIGSQRRRRSAATAPRR